MKRRNDTARTAAAELQRELQDTAQALRRAYERFNYVCDPELVESCVFEINALQAKYNYLLRLAKGPADSYVAALAAGGGSICLS
ncbi:MAG: DUF2508 family protein [Oscillospiraceae bacterium]|jgi:hypothetical protein|nr:DUF2508 family protein [Oscillospiraceae bacterium]